VYYSHASSYLVDTTVADLTAWEAIAISVGGLVLATASETYEEIRLARRQARPRRRARVIAVREAEPELHEHSRAA
jgi:uncharacterized membrane protein affecting hemolysin expression